MSSGVSLSESLWVYWPGREVRDLNFKVMDSVCRLGFRVQATGIRDWDAIVTNQETHTEGMTLNSGRAKGLVLEIWGRADRRTQITKTTSVRVQWHRQPFFSTGQEAGDRTGEWLKTWQGVIRHISKFRSQVITICYAPLEPYADTQGTSHHLKSMR